MPSNQENDKIKGRLFIIFIFFLTILAFATGTNYVSKQCEGMFRKDGYVWDSNVKKCVKVGYV